MKSNNKRTEKEGLRKVGGVGKGRGAKLQNSGSRAEPADMDHEGSIEMTLLCWMHLRDWEGPGEAISTWKEHIRPVEIISSFTNNTVRRRGWSQESFLF